MGEQDWLERGHGGGEGLQPMIKGSSGNAGDRVSIRSVLRGTDSPAPRRGARFRNKALVGWLIYCCTAVGGTAAAWTVRETLFPSLGAPTERSVWKNSNTETTPTTGPESESSEVGDDTVIGAAVVDTTVTIAGSPNEAQTVPSASLPGGGPNNTVDNHGSDGGNGPQTGTTVVGNPSGGPAADPNGGPVTTVDNHGGNTSTPAPTAASVSNPPASVDPPTSASIPGSVTTDDHGGGGGGGGNGSGGQTTLPKP